MSKYKLTVRVTWSLAAVVLCALVAGPWLLVYFNKDLRQMVCRPSSRQLVADLSSADRDEVMTALSHLRETRDPEGAAAATALLASEDEYVRLSAARYLGALGYEASIPYLIDGLRSPAWRAHDEIAATLRSLTGQDIGTDYETWAAWWDSRARESVGDP